MIAYRSTLLTKTVPPNIIYLRFKTLPNKQGYKTILYTPMLNQYINNHQHYFIIPNAEEE